jgi:hypothetical protein
MIKIKNPFLVLRICVLEREMIDFNCLKLSFDATLQAGIKPVSHSCPHSFLLILLSVLEFA